MTRHQPHLSLALFSSALFSLALLAVGCSAPDLARDARLLEHFHAELAPDAPPEIDVRRCEAVKPLATDKPHRVCVGTSQRRGLLTREGVAWATPATDASLLDARGAALAFAVAALGEGGPREARIEAISGERVETLWTATLEPSQDSGWIEIRFDLSPGVERLRLVSLGDEPVAWAELRLVASESDPPARPASATDTPPNLVLFLVDTLRADQLATYGYDRPTSPNLDRLAAESLVFERALSPSTWTLPSTASLLTGLLPLQHGARDIKHSMPQSVETVAEHLRAAGYRTAALTDGGFVGHKWGMAQGFDRFDAAPGKPWQDKDVAPIAASAAHWLETNHFEPFFLVVHTYETHQPYVNPEGFADPWLDPNYDGDRFRRRAAVQPLKIGEVSAAEKQRLIDFYDGEIHRADHYVGGLLDQLDALGLSERTAILLTSDHGEEFFDHGGVEHGHGRVFDANVRVPMVLRPPAARGIRPARVQTAASGLDVAPTLLDLAGLEPAPEWVGRSLLDLAAGAAPGRAVLVHGTNSIPQLDEERFRLDVGDTSLIYDRRRAALTYFDRAADPEMRRPLAAPRDPAMAESVEHLQAVLAWLAPTRFAVRLPSGLRRVTVPPSSRVAPLGVWDGLEWKGGEMVDHAWRAETTPEGVAYLVFDSRAAGEWTLHLERADGDEGEVTLHTRTADGGAPAWRPLSGELPPPLVLFPAAGIHAPGEAELSSGNVEELRALGYL